MKSIIQNEENPKCIVCNRTTLLHRHHVFYGTAHRKLSEQDGLVVYLCLDHHTGAHGVHTHNHALDIELKQRAQREYEKTHTRAEFMARYHKNYLD